jgi:hypothetical protein
MSDRTFTIPAQYVGIIDAKLKVDSPDGETATMELWHGGHKIAVGVGFRCPVIGLHTWWDAPKHDVVGTFAAFFAHAIETGEHDGWEFADDADEWDDALSMYAAELEESAKTS